MKIFLPPIVIACLVSAGCSTAPNRSASTDGKSAAAGNKQELILRNLLSSRLEGVAGTEVVVSHVTIPPNTTLPKHWHPGEEFAYVLEGSVTLWQKGKPDVVGNEGDVVKVPLKQIHTASTDDEGVTLLIFRVHEQGKPERINAD